MIHNLRAVSSWRELSHSFVRPCGGCRAVRQVDADGLRSSSSYSSFKELSQSRPSWTPRKVDSEPKWRNQLNGAPQWDNRVLETRWQTRRRPTRFCSSSRLSVGRSSVCPTCAPSQPCWHDEAPWEGKAAWCKKWDVCKMIDDNPGICLECIKEGMKAHPICSLVTLRGWKYRLHLLIVFSCAGVKKLPFNRRG